MNINKYIKKLIFPHISVALVLLPVSVILLVYSMVYVGTSSVISYVSYVLSGYTLTVWCFRIPRIIRFFKLMKSENRYIRRWTDDVRFRINLSLYGSVLWNIAYVIFQLCLGIYHSSFWFISLAAYYLCLAVIRLYFVLYTRKHTAGERMMEELKKYRVCGIIFLLMNLALTLMIFFMIYWGRTFNHHQITAIAMAAYTFTAFTMAVVNVVKYKKYKSPIYSATKIVSLAAASVSMLTLETTMFTAFGDGSLSLLGQKIMLGSSGGVISVFIIILAVYMIRESNRKIKMLKGK